jgi:amino-acid N-acetyltransferase
MNVLSAAVAIMSCSLWKLARVNAWTTSPSFRSRALSTKATPILLRGYNSFRYSSDDLPSGTNRKMSANGDSEYGNSTVMTRESAERAIDISGLPDHTADFRTGVQPILMHEDTVNILGIDPSHVEVIQRNGTRFDEPPPVLSVDDMFHNTQFVEMFRGSATYIANHRNTLMVFHIPGDYIDHEDPKIFRDLINDISLAWLLGVKIVIVAGCRYQVEKRVGERSKHLGMAVTDKESLRIVKEEAGYVRFEVERQLARSLQGSRGQLGEGNVVSGNFYSAQPFGVVDGVDYKYSGFIRRFEKEKIGQSHRNRDIVLLTALGVSPTGEVFNVNSEYLASYAGGALQANKVIFFLEQDVELRHKVHGTRIPHLRVNDGRALLKLNDIHMQKKGFVFVGADCPYDDDIEQNMFVKIGWSMQAIQDGVKRVHIITPENGALLQELYTRDGSGTMISSDLYDGIRQASVIDISGIHELITPLVEQGTLVERPKAKLEEKIHEYHVYTRDDLIVACGQVKMFENGFAEIGCLVVNSAYRARGRGDAMLGYLERLSVSKGASMVFVFSTQTMEWFIERGFDEVGVEMLPPSRQATYNHNRNSKIYMKKISSVRDLDAAELFWDR